jgi:hypothetical protein
MRGCVPRAWPHWTRLGRCWATLGSDGYLLGNLVGSLRVFQRSAWPGAGTRGVLPMKIQRAGASGYVVLGSHHRSFASRMAS